LPSRDGAALHRLRRSLRRVRYAREWLGTDTSELANEQDRLGAVCDLLALESFAHREHAKVPPQLTAAIKSSFDVLEAHS
jgi:CHAD domain-containing protein